MFIQITGLAGKSVEIIAKIKGLAFIYIPKMIGALILYVVGSWFIKKLGLLLNKSNKVKQYDPSLHSFLFSMIKVSLKVLLVVSILGMLGMDITAFSALLVGLSLAVGSALNGSLGNFAGGVMLHIFQPFKLGQKIEAQGHSGTVKEMGIFNTTLLSTDHKTIILPNGPLSTETIINHSAHGDLRVETVMAIASDQDIDAAREVALEAVFQHPCVLKAPAPEINVFKVADGMVTMAIRPYALQKDYWKVYFGVQENVKKAWDAAGIKEPVPQVIYTNKQGAF